MNGKDECGWGVDVYVGLRGFLRRVFFVMLRVLWEQRGGRLCVWSRRVSERCMQITCVMSGVVDCT